MKTQLASQLRKTCKKFNFINFNRNYFASFDSKFVKEYNEYGFSHIQNAFPKDLIDELKGEIGLIIEKADLEELKSTFDTKHESSDKYFIESGDKIRFFLEKNAFDEKGNLVYPIKESINKIGHALHDLNEKFEKFSYSEEVKYIVKALGYKSPIIAQSMYIFKNARVGGAVPPHTDNSYLRTKPLSCLGIWCAFDDASKDNGGLWGVPGSHKTATNYFFKRKVENNKEHLYYDPKEAPQYDIKNAVAIEAKKGDIVLLHGDFVHYSYDNVSNLQRHAYTLHLVESREHYWEKDNWIVRRDMPFRFLYEHLEKKI